MAFYLRECGVDPQAIYRVWAMYSRLDQSYFDHVSMLYSVLLLSGTRLLFMSRLVFDWRDVMFPGCPSVHLSITLCFSP